MPSVLQVESHPSGAAADVQNVTMGMLDGFPLVGRPVAALLKIRQCAADIDEPVVALDDLSGAIALVTIPDFLAVGIVLRLHRRSGSWPHFDYSCTAPGGRSER
ncbi:hypothetical protein SBA4_70040 [Candidatus Sulfopaludibacter sp. SbA4]|nr:hypothetical protein SBA4_70040 [Candidatus Sulfopaludibacter sp. SbA4]